MFAYLSFKRLPRSLLVKASRVLKILHEVLTGRGALTLGMVQKLQANEVLQTVLGDAKFSLGLRREFMSERGPGFIGFHEGCRCRSDGGG